MLSLPPPALAGPHSPGLGELGSTIKRLQPWPRSSGLWGGCGEPAALRCIPLAPSRQRGRIPAVNGGNALLGAPTCWGAECGLVLALPGVRGRCSCACVCVSNQYYRGFK